MKFLKEFLRLNYKQIILERTILVCVGVVELQCIYEIIIQYSVAVLA
jgi:hypothetical protein